MKIIFLLILLIVLSGCLSDKVLYENRCTERIATIGLPEMMINQGLGWLATIQIGETVTIDECYKITRESQSKFVGEILC